MRQLCADTPLVSAMVAAGAVVTKDVPGLHAMVGVPAVPAAKLDEFGNIMNGSTDNSVRKGEAAHEKQPRLSLVVTV